MTSELASLFWPFMVVIALVFVMGLYCILISKNLIRMLIGLEILTKAVTLLIIIAGFVTAHMALAQSLVITLIVVEVVVLAIAAGIIIGVYNHTKSLDVNELQELKG